MSKLDIGVGDEFPLDDGGPDRRERHGYRGHHFHHHRMHRGHHHHHRHGHGLGRFALLLVIAGLAALIVEHRLPAEAAYGMIALGVTGLAVLVVRHWRHHRQTAQVS